MHRSRSAPGVSEEERVLQPVAVVRRGKRGIVAIATIDDWKARDCGCWGSCSTNSFRVLEGSSQRVWKRRCSLGVVNWLKDALLRFTMSLLSPKRPTSPPWATWRAVVRIKSGRAWQLHLPREWSCRIRCMVFSDIQPLCSPNWACPVVAMCHCRCTLGLQVMLFAPSGLSNILFAACFRGLRCSSWFNFSTRCCEALNFH